MSSGLIDDLTGKSQWRDASQGPECGAFNAPDLFHLSALARGSHSLLTRPLAKILDKWTDVSAVLLVQARHFFW
jgi:hypothetical protein